MNTDLIRRIIALIPSESLKTKIAETGYVPCYFDMLAIAFAYAPDFATRLALLDELKSELPPDLSEYAGRLIDHQLAMLEAFKKPEPQTIFELHIKEDPDAFDERYICGSYEAALIIIPLFYQTYELEEAETVRYRIVKRRVYNGGEDEDFEEDDLGELEMISGMRIKTAELYSFAPAEKDCTGECYDCSELCVRARGMDIEFPCFIRHGDAVRCVEPYSGEAGFGIALQPNEKPCAEYYVIPLDSDRIMRRDFDNMHDAHEHIPAPLAERITADDLPEGLRSGYFACREFLKTDEYYGPRLKDNE